MTINSNVNKLTTWQETPIADSPFCRNPITVPPIQAAQFSPGGSFFNSQQATSLLHKESSSQKQSALNARQPRPKPPRPKPTRCYRLPNFPLEVAFSSSQQATSLLQKEGSSQKRSAPKPKQPRPKPPRPKPRRCYSRKHANGG